MTQAPRSPVSRRHRLSQETRRCLDDLSALDLLLPQGNTLQECERLLGIFVALDILHHHFYLTVLGDIYRLALLWQLNYHTRCIRLEVGDRFDISGGLHTDQFSWALVEAGLNSVLISSGSLDPATSPLKSVQVYIQENQENRVQTMVSEAVAIPNSRIGRTTYPVFSISLPVCECYHVVVSRYTCYDFLRSATVTCTVRILLALCTLGCPVAVADGDSYLSVKQRLYGQLEPTYGRAMRLPIETLDQLPHYRDMRHRGSASSMLGAAVRPTGFFRPEKRDGRWWLIDPYGHQRLSIAVNSVRVNSKKSVEGMTAVRGSAQHGATAAMDAWQIAITDLWASAGFNGFGAWSELSGLEGLLEVKRDYHYAINLNLLGDYLKTLDRPGGYLPVFDPDFAMYAQKRMQALSHLAIDPKLLGYFTDNELAFWYVDPGDYLVIEDQDAPAHQAVLSWLSEQELEPEQMTPTDRARFRLFVLEQYLEVVKAAIASVDTNHMVLGPRLYGPEINDEAFMRVLGRYVDLVSINFYQKLRPGEKQMLNWEAWTGRPFLISEFSIKAGDSGKANASGAGWLVDTDADRGLFYQHFTLGLLASRSCVGFHWYRYRDSPGERGVNKGIVNDALEPYPDLLESMGAVNRQAYFLVDYFDNRRRH